MILAFEMVGPKASFVALTVAVACLLPLSTPTLAGAAQRARENRWSQKQRFHTLRFPFVGLGEIIGGLRLRGGGEEQCVVLERDPDEGSEHAQNGEEESVVTAFEVKGKVDYGNIVERFGSQLLTQELIERLEKVTGLEAHYLVRRGFVFSHRDLDALLDLYEKGTPFFLYTGRCACAACA